MSDERRTYRFGPVERHSFLGPVRAGQAIVITGSLLVGLILLSAQPSPGHLLGALALIALAVVSSTVPVAGRTAEQWAPVASTWLLRRVAGLHRHQAQALPAMWRVPASAVVADAIALPRALRGVQIVEHPYRCRQVAIVSEHGGRLLTAVLACQVVSFSLLDAAAQERGLSAWGTLLAACADTPVRRVQWLERTLPAEGDQLERWLAAQRDRRIPPGRPIVDSYVELIDHSVQVSQPHEVLIAVQVDASRVRGRGSQPTAVLIQEVERLADALRRTGVRVDGALAPRRVAGLFRTAFDPYLPAIDGCAEPTPRSDTQSAAGPLAAIEGWDHYRSDGAVHRTYWISAWPRVEVGALFLDPLLAGAGSLRTIAVTFEPAASDRSIREVEAQVTRDQADRALRARFGQAETARDQQAYGATRRRESELAAGYSEVRFAGFVTVTAPDVEQLRDATATVARDAARARLELRPMFGQQADAFTFTLPLCRGFR